MASSDQFSKISNIILDRAKEFEKIVVVVSAMANMTDQLIALAHYVNPKPPQREMDMLISVGERVSMSLLAMALDARGFKAKSFTGSQSGIITNHRHTEALIQTVRPHRLLTSLENDKIVIVAGFQGVSNQGEITTLGRGGSDTSAVALAIALNAVKVEFYKDVKGVFDKDPKFHASPLFFKFLTYKKALNIIDENQPILHPRCIRLASNHALPLFIRSFIDFSPNRVEGTLIQDSKRDFASKKKYEI